MLLNTFVLNTDRKIAFVKYIAELMKATSIYEISYDPDIINEEMHVLLRKIQ